MYIQNYFVLKVNMVGKIHSKKIEKRHCTNCDCLYETSEEESRSKIDKTLFVGECDRCYFSFIRKASERKDMNRRNTGAAYDVAAANTRRYKAKKKKRLNTH